MPSIFLKNVPTGFATRDISNFCGTINISQAQQLYAKIAEAAGCRIDVVDIFLSNEKHQLLSHLGQGITCPNVHATVEWYGSEERGLDAKQKIADAIQEYLNSYSAGKGLDITFHDSPAGSFFTEKDGKSVVVPGGEALPPFQAIAQTVYFSTGTISSGVNTGDEG